MNKLVLAVFIIFSMLYGQNWNEVLPWPYSEELNGVGELNNNFFAVGNNGTVLRSDDNGKNWILNYGVSGLNEDFTSMAVVNSQKAFITTANGLLLKTTDGGISWTSGYLHNGIQLNYITFLDSLYGWCFGSDSYCFTTTDGGQNWMIRSSANDLDIKKAVFLDPLIGYCIAKPIYYEINLYKTTDGGVTWGRVSGSGGFRDFYFKDELHGFGISGATLHKTHNGGAAWTHTQLSQGIIDNLQSICFINEKHGFIPGTYNIYRTINGGGTWTSYPMANANNFKFFYQTTDSSIYALGKNGFLIKSTDLGLNWQLLHRYFKYDYYSINFSTDSTGWMIGRPLAYNDGKTYILKSTDGGKIWDENNILN
ncbi:MAG: hypothetical protein K8H86_02330, partial [Ignavibacteriaceae bacterium]|nr:hypothetical protein [Ignavibacteriaceae bacterium]